jgi:fructose-1,6-bisphosphatase II
MYMEKLVCGPEAKGFIDLSLPLEQNVKLVAKALNKPLEELVVVTLAKPRHDAAIARMQGLGVRVFALPDGDVAASILTCMPDSEVDMMYCIGGAPEGVISAAVIRALGGDMQGRLGLRTEAKGDDPQTVQLAEDEKRRCAEMGVEPNRIFQLEEMVRSDNVVFSASGITKGDLLEGIRRKGNLATTETLLIRGKSRTVRKIQSTHCLDRKDDDVKDIILADTAGNHE